MAEPKEPLTERELEVVKLVAEGASNKQIAAALFISENTVKVHLKNIFVKLEAESRARVAAIAQRNGWVAAPAAPVELSSTDSTLAPAALEAPVAAAVAPEIVREVDAQVVVAPVITPVPVAPNPEALPPLTTWRRVASLVVVAAIALGSVLSLQINRTRAQPEADGEFQPATGAQAPADASAASRWFVRAPLPAARTRSAAFGVRGKIYLAGGTLDRSAAGGLLVFDPQRNEWRAGAEKPTPLRLAAGAVFSDVIYLPGGTDANGAPTARFEAYDTSAQTWATLPALPRAMSGHVVAALDNRIYVFGGRTSNENFNTEGYVFDLGAQRWSRVPAMPTARSQAAAVAVQGRIYVIGGTDGQREYNTCEYFDAGLARWSSCRPMSIARGGLGLAQVGANLYAIGGGVTSNYIPFNEKYDVMADRWQPFEIPVSRAGVWKNTAVASLATEFYVVGGSTGVEARGETYVYEVLTNKSFLPSLQNSTP